MIAYPMSVIVDGVPYQYEAEASAGIELVTHKKWWGTRIRYRKGPRGRWNHIHAVDVHPFDAVLVRDSLVAYLKREGVSA